MSSVSTILWPVILKRGHRGCGGGPGAQCAGACPQVTIAPAPGPGTSTSCARAKEQPLSEAQCPGQGVGELRHPGLLGQRGSGGQQPGAGGDYHHLPSTCTCTCTWATTWPGSQAVRSGGHSEEETSVSEDKGKMIRSVAISLLQQNLSLFSHHIHTQTYGIESCWFIELRLWLIEIEN